MARFSLAAGCLAFWSVIAPLNAETFGDWETQCDPGCRTLTVTKIKIYSDQVDPYAVVLEIDLDGRLVVSGLATERMHYDLFTNKAPVEIEQDGTPYVAARTFFNTNFPAKLLVDGQEVLELSTEDESHLSAMAAQEIIDAFRGGATATLQARGKPDISFSLAGFTAAYAARTESQTASQEANPSSERNPITVVAASISGNRYGLSSQHLLTRDNPLGNGVFVYVPKVKIAGYDRYFIWFVKNGEAVALNGPAISLNSEVPRPLDMGFEFWRETGLSAYDVTRKGLDTAYGVQRTP